MKKTITRFVLLVLSLLILTTTAFATSEDTPVKIMLVDAYDLTSLTMTLENTSGELTKITFYEKDDFIAITNIPAGSYKISKCEYVSPNDTKYTISVQGTTFTIPESNELTTIKLTTGQKPRENNLLDFLNQSKVPIIVLIICGIIYLYLQRKQSKTVKAINPELQRMMEEHEAMQEFYQSDKIDYSQYSPQNNKSEQVSFENEYAEDIEE